MKDLNKAKGVIFGLAIGDALGSKSAKDVSELTEWLTGGMAEICPS